MSSLPTWVLFAIGVGTPVLAFAGALIGQIVTPQAEVEVTPSQVDAARLIIEIDRAAGKETPGLIHKIASARPPRRRPGIGLPSAAQSPADLDEPTRAAEIIIGLAPEADQAPSGQGKKLPRRGGPRGRLGRRDGPREAR